MSRGDGAAILAYRATFRDHFLCASYHASREISQRARFRSARDLIVALLYGAKRWESARFAKDVYRIRTLLREANSHRKP